MLEPTMASSNAASRREVEGRWFKSTRVHSKAARFAFADASGAVQ